MILHVLHACTLLLTLVACEEVIVLNNGVTSGNSSVEDPPHLRSLYDPDCRLSNEATKVKLMDFFKKVCTGVSINESVRGRSFIFR